MRIAVILMYVGAALSAINLLVTLVIFDTIVRAFQDASAAVTAGDAHTFAVAAIVLAVVETGLWLLMAYANNLGRAWARIVASVLFGLNTLLLLYGFARASISVSQLFAVVVWLVGLSAIVLLWRRESAEFFTAASEPE
ncbi:MAG TPA: hypothetical protein VIX86_24330 [Streptosporangiaceae bacterium]